MPTLLIALLVALAAATANATGFALRAHGLEQRWDAAEAAGVPAASLEPARRELAAEQARRMGLLPYALVSGAAVSDPFTVPEAHADAAYRAALTAARGRAADALRRRHEAAGPNDQGQADRIVQLARASRPASADSLARRWNTEAAQLEDVRRRLAGPAGGLIGGLPADVVAGTAALSDLTP